MNSFTVVIFLLLGCVAAVLSTDFANLNSESTTSASTTSAHCITESRVVRAATDDDDSDDDDDDDDKAKKTAALSSKTQNSNTNGESGGSKALKFLRQHRVQSSSSSKTIKDEQSTTTRRSRHERAAARVKNLQVTRQVQPFDADSGAPGGPGTQDDSQSSDSPAFTPPIAVPQSTGRQAPQAAPRPQNPPPQTGGSPASLTLPDGAEVIVGDIKAGFTCASKIYGYYADIFNDCKLFHVCVPVGDENGVTNPIQWSFVCGNQTLFNQEKLTCDHQDNVDCSKSESFYSINENFGRPEDKAAVAPGGPAPVPAPTRG